MALLTSGPSSVVVCNLCARSYPFRVGAVWCCGQLLELIEKRLDAVGDQVGAGEGLAASKWEDTLIGALLHDGTVLRRPMVE